MIKFFRNLPAGKAGINQKLIQEGKIANYLKYAIGEILLVVIGISSVSVRGQSSIHEITSRWFMFFHHKLKQDCSTKLWSIFR